MNCSMNFSMNNKMTRLKRSLVLVGACLAFSNGVQAGEMQTLKNMERERSALVSTSFAVDTSVEIREQKVEGSKQRLVDLERMVIRDDQLLGNNHRLVQHAFSDYELSFLVHSSAEAGKLPVSMWLAEVGLDTADVQSARVGRR